MSQITLYEIEQALAHNATLILTRETTVDLEDALFEICILTEEDRRGNAMDTCISAAFLECISQKPHLLEILKMLCKDRSSRSGSRVNARSSRLLSSVPELGCRTAVPCIDFETGEIFFSGLSYKSREQLIESDDRLRVVDSAFRNNEWLREQLDMDGSAIGSFSLKGARFPRCYDEDEGMLISNLMNSDCGYGKCSIYTERSTFSETMYLPGYNMPSQSEIEPYSTSSEESKHIYTPAQLPICFVSPDLNVDGFEHAVTRVVAQLGVRNLSIHNTEFHNGVSGLMTSTATLGNGISIPNMLGKSYRLVLDVEDVRVVDELGDEHLCKIVFAVSCSLKIRRRKKNGKFESPTTVSLSRYVSELTPDFERVPIDLNTKDWKNFFLITVIPQAIVGSQSMLRCTGMPVIPDRYSWSETYAPVTITRSVSRSTLQGQAEDDSLLTQLKVDLACTNQWLNLKTAYLDSHLARRSKSVDLKKVEVTKYGFEFADIEYIKRKHIVLFKALYKAAILSLSKKTGKTCIDVEEWWDNFYREASGPSIVHSEEIRSPDAIFSGMKQIDKELLLVRLIMSRLFTVGNGEGLNVGETPKCSHTFNQKRIEKTLIPLSVLKDGLAVYSLSNVSLKVIINVYGQNIKEEALKTLLARSIIGSGPDRMGTLQDGSRNILFFINSKIIKVKNKTVCNSRRHWLAAPSGFEYDVRPIIADICQKLRVRARKGLTLSGESVMVWHPLFCLIVSISVQDGDISFAALMLPAKRKSSIVSTFHNNKKRKDTLVMDGSLDLPVHAGVRRDDLGFFEALGNFAPDNVNS
jgi:hypothetical protein